MTKFISRIAQDILEQNSKDLSNLCVVFPTRRACLFFKKEIARNIQEPIWLPSVLSIQDFIQSFSQSIIPDKLTLVFELFSVYRKYFPNEVFERFYPWGQMLLSDFEEIDIYLINSKKLFSYIYDLKTLETEFPMETDEAESIKKFWGILSDKELSLLKSEFINVWAFLQDIYNDYRELLLRKKHAYAGMLYRAIAEDCINDNLALLKWEKLVFAGFYALSSSEEVIIKYFIDKGKADIYWDIDEYYLNDENQEAGKFLRKRQLISSSFKWKTNSFQEIERKIEIIGVPLQIGQAKALGNELSRLIETNQIELENTAVVLPDENMLFPVLYSLPESIEKINVTMGYSLQSTPLYNLFDTLIRLHTNAKIQNNQILAFGNKYLYYYKDVIDVLKHPYILFLDSPAKQISKWVNNCRKNNWIYVSEANLINKESPEFFNMLFTPVSSVEEAFPYFSKLLKVISATLKDEKRVELSAEQEYIFHFYAQLRKLEDVVIQHKAELNLDTFWILFKEILHTTKIPFTGEPLEGLQIMGFLETRVLDFKTLFILSVNENILPAGRNKNSYIPFSLRKAVGLTTHEDQDAIYAYHFYRLLQRAENIYLYYNTEVQHINSGEKSRYILQIEHELKKRLGDKLNLKQKLVSTAIRNYSIKEIQVPKDEEVFYKLNRYTKREQNSSYQPGFSATALTSYINCSLQFYFRYLAGLKEQEMPEEFIQEVLFGRIFHKAIERLYKPLVHFDKDSADKLKGLTSQIANEVFKEEAMLSEIEGKNLLYVNIIAELLNKILEADKKNIPFVIKDLEKEMEVELNLDNYKKVKLVGILDRVDETNKKIRILDYKTGNVNIKKSASMEDIFKSSDHKILFQAHFYAYLYWKENPEKEISLGIYPIKKLNEGILYLKDQSAVLQEDFFVFEEHLKNLLKDLFNKDIPFVQTVQKEHCQYCSYKGICNR